MAKKMKVEIDQEEYNEYLQLKMEKVAKQFEEEHKFKVYTFDKRTYITCKINDYITRECESYLIRLLQLMNIEYAALSTLEEYGLSIEGDNLERAVFIQKFIDDGYTLKWK